MSEKKANVHWEGGGRNGKGLTYANPIQAVLSALKVKLAY